MPLPSQTFPGGLTRIEWAVFVVLTGGALTLILGSPWLPMNDASSHIATSVILRDFLRGDAFTTEHYAFGWAPLPYWMPTLLQEPLLSVASPRVAFALVVALYALGLPWALLQLLRFAAPENAFLALFGSLAIFNTAYWLGEVGYLLGQPLMLIAYAVFLRIETFRSRSLYGFAALAVAVYLSHVFALVALLGAVGVMVLVRGRSPYRLVPAQLAAVGWTAALFGLAAWLIVVAHGTQANSGEMTFDYSLFHFGLIVTYPLDIPAPRGAGPSLAFVVLAFGLLLAPTVEGLLRRREKLSVHVNLPIALPAAALAAVALFGPSGIKEAYSFEDIAQRFTLPALLFAVGAVRFTGTPRRRLIIVSAIFAFGLFRLALAWRVHDDYQETADHVATELLDRIPEQSRVLPLMDIDRPNGSVWRVHRFANYVVPLRHGYSPHVFARTGQQALRHAYFGDYRRVEDLAVSASEWAFYDYVLVQSDREVPHVPGLLTHCALVAAVDGFRLYRTSHPASHAAP